MKRCIIDYDFGEMRMKRIDAHLPRRISRRLLERGAQGEKRAVVVFKNGKPSSVWGFDEYLARQNLTKVVEPWKHRRDRTPAEIDPLGAVEGAPSGPITRDEMYE